MKKENTSRETNTSEKKNINAKSIALSILALIGYHLIFWHESFGLNTIIFTSAILGWSFYSQKRDFLNKTVLATAVITLLLSFLIAIHGSFLAKFSYICSLLIYLGFLFNPSIKSIISALPGGLFNIPVSFIHSISITTKQIKIPKKYNGTFRFLKFTLMPLAVLFVFLIIFNYANPVFNNLTSNVLDLIGRAIAKFFSQLSWAWIFFMIFGMIIISGIALNGNIKMFAKYEEKSSDSVIRRKIRSFRRFKMIGLKDENRTGVILMILINLLLFIMNFIDIQWIWFNFSLTGNQTYSQLVHEGTYLLILSILISMGIIFYYFRRNQNFYVKNRPLKVGAYLWIIQNIIMVISVAIRNLRYIDEFGLTNKRIGVLVFLIMTMVGLVTLFIKVRNKKSTFFVLKINSWAMYLLFFVLSIFNWDIIVVRFNLNMPETKPIDKEYLLTFSDKTLPYVYANRARFMDPNKFTINYGSDYRGVSYIDKINQRVAEFTSRAGKENETFLSWNYADDRAMLFFKE